MWREFEHPLFGLIRYTVDEQEFMQAGYVLKSVEQAEREDGSPLTADECVQLERDLKAAGRL